MASNAHARYGRLNKHRVLRIFKGRSFGAPLFFDYSHKDMFSGYIASSIFHVTLWHIGRIIIHDHVRL